MNRLLALLLLVVPAAAVAQDAAKKEADALFFEGKRLMANGNIPAGCFKFEASLTRLEQLGVRLNLADCYEQAGRLASAWRQFRRAAEQAERSGDDRARFARARRDALVPKLPRLRITGAAGAMVRADGVPVDAGGAPDPIDPGPHEIAATVAGVETLRTRVNAEIGSTLAIDVPAASPPAAAPAPVPAVAPEDVPPSPGSGQRLAAYVVGGVGLAGLGIAAVASAIAVSRKNDAGCDGGRCPDQGSVDKLRGARSMGTVATIAVGIGAAAVVTGVVLYITAPRSTDVRVSVAPGSLGISGKF
jgi:hypothetical protein